MADPNILYSPEHSISLLSKSSPSQLQAFQFKRSRTQPIPTETLTLQKANKTASLSHVPCKFFKQGTCTAGANCTFSHSSDISSESSVCRYFIKGNCKFGTKCALLHTMSPYSNSGGNGIDPKLRLNERSGSSSSYSYSSSSFTTIDDNPMWNPRDLMALHTSPYAAAATASFGTSPFNNNSKWSIPPSSLDNTINNGNNISNGININNSNNSNYLYQREIQQVGQNDHVYEDLNDAMLPSSLNDLFTPSELQLRRLRQQEEYSSSYSPTRESAVSSTLPDSLGNHGSKWRVPFITKNDWLDYDDSNTKPTMSVIGNRNNSSYLQQQDEDDVQFFMEEDESAYDTMEINATLSTLFQNNMKINQNNVHHSLL